MLEKRQEGAPMDEAWKVFEASGKVTDYLEFCTARKEQEECTVKIFLSVIVCTLF